MEHETANFDSLAHAYRWLEYVSFGRTLERCRFRYLARCSQARHALILGDGDGRFTARLLEANPRVQVDAVDASAAMLAVLRERVRQAGPNADSRLTAIQADIRQFNPMRWDYDLVVSHFFLDCLTQGEVDALIARLSPRMSADAIWLVSEFAVPEKGWRRLAARALIRSLYLASSILTGLRANRIPNFAKALNDNGFQAVETQAYRGGMLTTQVWKRRPDQHSYSRG